MTQPRSIFQFNPVTSTPRASFGSLIPVNRSTDEGRRERSPSIPRALPPIPVPEPRHREAAGQRDDGHRSVPTSEGAEKGPPLGLLSPPPPEDNNRGFFGQNFADVGRVLGISVAQEALVRSAKACVLAAKVMSHRFRCSRRDRTHL